MTKRSLLLLITLLYSVPIFSQDFEPACVRSYDSISLQNALDMAFERNPAIEAAHYKILAGKRKQQAAIGMRFPQLSITGNYVHMGKNIAIDANHLKPSVVSSAKDLVASGLKDGIIPPSAAPLIEGALSGLAGADWSINLQQKNFGIIAGELTLPIFMGGRINIANRVAHIDRQIAEQQYDSTSNTLTTEVIERYFGLLVASNAIEVRELLVEAMQNHLQDAIIMEQSGIIARSERLFIEYKMAEAERELQEAQLRQKTIAEALSFTLNTDFEHSYTPSSPMFFIATLPDVDYFKTQALNRNPQLAEIDLQRQLAKEDIHLKRAEFFPQIVALAGSSFYNYRVTPMFPRWAVGIGVELKLFNGLTREYNYAAACEQASMVEYLHQQARNEVLTLIESLYNGLRNCHNRILSLNSSISFAEEYLHNKRIAFTEGLTTATDLTDAELNLSKALIERIEAVYAFDVTLARLLQAAGISDSFCSYMNAKTAKIIEFNNQNSKYNEQ